MNKFLTLAIAVIVIATVILAVSLTLFSKPINNNKSNQNAQTSNNTNSAAKYIPAQTIRLTTAGFDPATLKIKKGTRVVWANQSGTVGSVNSDNYPTNLLYPFLNFGQFKNGSSFSTIFDKTGRYTYYNFSNREQKGTIIVE